MHKTIDLNGLWRFTPDLDPTYHDRYEANYASPDWNHRQWEAVPVPACWNTYGDRYALYEGVCWFVRTFDLPDWTPGHLGVLRFGAINYEAQVFVNGQPAGEHQGGYTEFTLEVSRWLHPGKNLLAVRVDNRRHRILLPACMGWFNYGGIHRDVTLEVSDGARLDWVGVEAVPLNGGAQGRIQIEVRSMRAETLRLQAVVRDPDDTTVWEMQWGWPGGDGRVDQPFSLSSARPWGPASPALYELELALSTPSGALLDRRRMRFGVRKISTEGLKLLLNGEPLWLKGLCYLLDHPVSGIAHNPTVMRRDLDDFQALGLNAVRCHVPMHQQMLDECDRRGLLVWSEVPIYCLDPIEETASAFSAPAYVSLATQMLREMVRAAYNHPSVILWSLGNECQVAHPEALAFFTTLAHTVRSLDTSRLLGYASLYGDLGSVADLVDVIGINEYWGWYDRVDPKQGDRPLLEQVRENPDGGRTVQVGALDLARLRQEVEDKARRYSKPLVLTEFGADAVPGYRSEDLRLWSEDYQALFLHKTYQVLAETGKVVGAFPFLYQDYPDPSKYVGAYWNGLNLKGIVSYHRERKAAFDVLRTIYQNEPALSVIGTM